MCSQVPSVRGLKAHAEIWEDFTLFVLNMKMTIIHFFEEFTIGLKTRGLNFASVVQQNNMIPSRMMTPEQNTSTEIYSRIKKIKKEKKEVFIDMQCFLNNILSFLL